MINDRLLKVLAPTAFVKRSAPTLLSKITGPILDVAGGSGRHAFYLAALGAKVICLDKDVSAYLKLTEKLSDHPNLLSRVTSMHVNLVSEPWTFDTNSIGAILMVHYLQCNLFSDFTKSLKRGGWLLAETVGGQGGNYRELPKAGALKEALIHSFELITYEERKVGPEASDAVAVSLLAQKR